MYGAICVLLTLQNSSYTLLRRYSSGVLQEQASSQSILAMGEVFKALFCIWMLAHDRLKRAPSADDDDGAAPRESASVLGQAKRLTTSSLPMAVPAVIFLAMNLLSFISLRRISASAFTLIQQSKIIFTAVLSRLILGKSISAQRWRALISLLLAVLIICYETRRQMRAVDCNEVAPEAPHIAMEASSADFAAGVAAVAMEAALSGLSNVYFEKVLKSTSLSVWERNIQLASYSLVIYLPTAVWVLTHIA